MSDLPSKIFQQIVDHIDEGLMITENHQSDWRICYVNNAFTEITGYSAEEALGKNPRFLQGDDNNQSSLSEIHEALNNNQTCSVTLRNYSKDGEAFWNRITIKPLLSKDGFITHFVGQIESLGALSSYDLENSQKERAFSNPIRDPQTGLFKQDYFEAQLFRDWHIWMRENKALSLAIFTPDHFDIYKKTFGAATSDSALRKIAYIINSSLRRASDLVARCYDDSIVCLMLGEQADEDEKLLKGIANKVDNLLLHNPHAPDSKYLTVSFTAMSTLPSTRIQPADYLKELIKAHQLKQHVVGSKTYIQF